MNRRERNSGKLRKLATTGILVGIMLVLALTNFAVIPIPFLPGVYMSFCCVPIVIGTLICGLDTGLLLGGIFGLSSVWKAFTAPSVLVIPLMGASPVYVIVMSLGARLLIPVTVWLIDKAFKKHVVAGNIVSSAAGSLTNTVFYLGLMLLFYVMAGFDASSVLALIASVGALNGSLEAIACMVVCPPVVYALRKSFLKKTT